MSYSTATNTIKMTTANGYSGALHDVSVASDVGANGDAKDASGLHVTAFVVAMGAGFLWVKSFPYVFGSMYEELNTLIFTGALIASIEGAGGVFWLKSLVRNYQMVFDVAGLACGVLGLILALFSTMKLGKIFGRKVSLIVTGSLLSFGAIDSWIVLSKYFRFSKSLVTLFQ